MASKFFLPEVGYLGLMQPKLRDVEVKEGIRYLNHKFPVKGLPKSLEVPEAMCFETEEAFSLAKSQPGVLSVLKKVAKDIEDWEPVIVASKASQEFKIVAEIMNEDNETVTLQYHSGEIETVHKRNVFGSQFISLNSTWRIKGKPYDVEIAEEATKYKVSVRLDGGIKAIVEMRDLFMNKQQMLRYINRKGVYPLFELYNMTRTISTKRKKMREPTLTKRIRMEPQVPNGNNRDCLICCNENAIITFCPLCIYQMCHRCFERVSDCPSCRLPFVLANFYE